MTEREKTWGCQSTTPSETPLTDEEKALCAHIASLETALTESRAENEQWRTWGVIEIAIRNPSVAEYVEHWEGRTEKAEAECERLRRDAERLDWLADKNNYYGEVKLPTLFVVKHVDSLRDAIDATMKFAAIDAASAGER